MGLEINILRREHLQDFKQLLNVFDIVFEYTNSEKAADGHLIELLQNHSFLAIVARSDCQIIGGLTAYVLPQYHADKPVLYIQDLAVSVDFQRMGIGRKLMAFTLDHCKQNGFQQMYVLAEQVDDYAVDFYRKTNPSGDEPAVYFYYNLMEKQSTT
jgi:aminoglycoside 3-N-acetyltransferase I